MKNHLTLVAPKANAKKTISKGLAPIVCYEPWFPRFLESVKQSINDGHPVLIRLHSAASYPINTEERYVNDLESHAVLIVGYDDVKQAVALVDPWNKNWGGTQGGRWWLPYPLLATKNVDGSIGVAMCLAPLEVTSELQYDNVGNLSIKLQVGFYLPKGTVMDLGSWAITNVRATCTLPDSWAIGNVEHSTAGNWIVGESVNLTLPLANNPKNNGEIKLHICANIEGKRPYDFKDEIEVSETLLVEADQYASMKENRMCTVS